MCLPFYLRMFLLDFLECDESGDNDDDRNEGRGHHFSFLFWLGPLGAATMPIHLIAFS